MIEWLIFFVCGMLCGWAVGYQRCMAKVGAASTAKMKEATRAFNAAMEAVERGDNDEFSRLEAEHAVLSREFHAIAKIIRLS